MGIIKKYMWVVHFTIAVVLLLCYFFMEVEEVTSRDIYMGFYGVYAWLSILFAVKKDKS